MNALTLAVLRYLDEHPYAGATVQGGPITFARDGETVTLIGEAPEHTEVTLDFLRAAGPLVTFDEHDGTLTLDVHPQALRYRPLYIGDHDIVMCERAP